MDFRFRFVKMKEPCQNGKNGILGVTICVGQISMLALEPHVLPWG